MIDTIEIKVDLVKKKIYDDIYSRIDTVLRENNLMFLHKDRNNPNRYVSAGLAKYGFLEISFSHIRHRFFWEIRLQPIRLLKAGEFVELSRMEDYEEISHRFNFAIEKLLGFSDEEPLTYVRFENWRVNRIDYALNFETPYKCAYLYLLHHGNIPTGFNQYNIYADSLYLGSDSTNINFYDKFAQLSSKSIAPEEIEPARNILRLEVQCKAKAVSRLREDFALKDSTVRYLWNSHIAMYVLRNKISAILGELDFMRFSDAKNIVFDEMSKPMRYNDLMRMIAESPNANLAKKTYCKAKKCTANYYEKLTAKLRKHGINPITLPDSIEIPTNVKILPNPCRLLKT